MTGERLSDRESEGVYQDFPWLPGWDQVMTQESLSGRLAVIMAALESAGEQEPISPNHLDPIGLADWVGPPESRPLARVRLTADGEIFDFGANGRLALRNKYQCDRRGRPASLVESVYRNPESEPLLATKPTSIRAHSWKYDDRLAAPLVGASYSEYLQPTPGLVEQSVSTYWFVPPQPLPNSERGFIDSRLRAAGEIIAKYCGGQLTMLTAITSGPGYDPRLGANSGLIPTRRLRIELSAGEVCDRRVNRPATGISPSGNDRHQAGVWRAPGAN